MAGLADRDVRGVQKRWTCPGTGVALGVMDRMVTGPAGEVTTGR